jgi:hypothetical protein
VLGGGWGPYGDGSYAAFLTFSDLTEQPLSTLVSSNILQVSLGGPISISGDGSPQYRICADDTCSSETQTWGSTAGTISAGEFLQLRLTTTASPGTASIATANVGAAGDSWSVTTVGPDTTPDAFSFTDQTDVALSTLITSNSVNITGITGSVSVSVSGDGSPQVRVNGGSWTAGPTTITDGQSLEVRLTSNAANSTMNSATVTVGTVSDQWDVTTASAEPCAGSPSPGDVCADGSVYAGLSPDGNVKMYTTPADEGGIPWNNGNGSGYVTTSQTSTVTGEANTANLITIDSDSGVGGTQPHQAAQACADLSAHGQTDWYLPAKDELNVLYANEAAIGGFNTSGSFPAGYYWSSSENGSNFAWPQRFSDGVQGLFNGKANGLSVRCVRS